MHALAVAEEGGRVPEMMRHQQRHYHEEAERRLRTLTRAASGAVWLVYAGLMVLAIFRIASVYLNALKG
jgi:type II secretory pathway component PulF